VKDPIKVLVRRAGQEPTVEVIENDLLSKQNIVGGMIEMPHNPAFSNGLQIVCNEEGKFLDDPKPNVYWGDYDVVCGDILFVGIDDNSGDTVSLTPEQIAEAKAWIKENDASEITEANIDHRELAEVIVDLYADIGILDIDPTNGKATVKGKEKDKGSEM
jgi:hypothetical protein